METLTNREREVVALVAHGLSNDEIADAMVLSPATAKTHVSRAMIKLGARDRAQLVVFAYQTRLVTPRTAGARAINLAVPGLLVHQSCNKAVPRADLLITVSHGRQVRRDHARALLLDTEEHEYLRSLVVVAARRAPQPPAPPSRSVRGTVRLLLETVRPNPAYVLSRTRRARRQPGRRAAASRPGRPRR